jgi:adenylate kinase
MPSYVVLLGPPGAGKGTQAERISDQLGLAHISSGDIFRENLKNLTELGQKAQVFMNRGELVPDDLTIEMIKDRLQRDDCKAGALLDGFPRTPAQAEALGKMLATWNGKVDCVPYISVPPQELIGRLSGRWTCKAQGHVYHEKFNQPKAAGVCDVDGSELYQREDDQAATVERRISVYLAQTTPLIDYYRTQGVLAEVDGTLAIDQVTTLLLKAIKKG